MTKVNNVYTITFGGSLSGADQPHARRGRRGRDRPRRRHDDARLRRHRRRHRRPAPDPGQHHRRRRVAHHLRHRRRRGRRPRCDPGPLVLDRRVARSTTPRPPATTPRPAASRASRSIRPTRTSSTSRPPAAAPGRPRTAAGPGTRCSTTPRPCSRAPSPSPRAIRASSISAPARPTTPATPSTAPASTSRSTPAAPGHSSPTSAAVNPLLGTAISQDRRRPCQPQHGLRRRRRLLGQQQRRHSAVPASGAHNGNELAQPDRPGHLERPGHAGRPGSLHRLPPSAPRARTTISASSSPDKRRLVRPGLRIEHRRLRAATGSLHGPRQPWQRRPENAVYRLINPGQAGAPEATPTGTSATATRRQRHPQRTVPGLGHRPPAQTGTAAHHQDRRATARRVYRL